MTKLIPYPKPYRLPPDLEHSVRRYFMLADGLPEDADALDRPGIGFSPGAADAADRMTKDRKPTSPEVIGQWMTDLADATATRPSREVIMGRIRATIRTLGDLPAFCWTEDTLTLASGQFTHYPAVAELKPVLQPLADQHEREIALLREMARPRPMVEYRESTVKYVPPFPGDHIGRPGRDTAAAPKGFRSIGQVVADLTPPKPKLAEGEVDLLAARRAKFGQ